MPISVPQGLVAGQYHLIGAAGPPHQLTQFASTRRTLTVSAAAAVAAATNARVEHPLPRPGPFSIAPISDAFFRHPKGTLREVLE